MDHDKEIALIHERQENLKSQVARFISHLESEQRVTGNISKRVDDANRNIETHAKQLEKYDSIIFNKGRGLIFDVDRLVRMSESNKDRGRFVITTTLSIAAIILSIVTIIIMITQTP